jgi:hypothetical protein
MTKPAERVQAAWAVHSKEPGDHKDMRVLACFGGPEYQSSYTRVLDELNPGNTSTDREGEADSLPYIVIGPVDWDEESGPARAVTVCEWTSGRDGFERPIARTLLYLLPPLGEREGRVSLHGLGLAVAGSGRPAPAVPAEDQRVQLTVRFRPRAAETRWPADLGFAWLAWAAVAALERPVVIVEGEAPLSWPHRLEVLDAILSLLPAGLRPAVSAATWTGANAPRSIRLSFGFPSDRQVREIHLGRLPDPAHLPQPLADLAHQIVSLADQDRGGAVRVLERLEQMTEPRSLGPWQDSVRAIRDGLRQLDLIRYAWHERRAGHVDPQTILDALADKPPRQLRRDDREQVDDLIDTLIIDCGQEGLRGLARLEYWEPAWPRAMRIIRQELTGPGPAGGVALAMWPAVLDRGEADRFLAELVGIAVADRSGTATRKLVDIWVAIADRIPAPELMPRTRARIFKYEHFVTVLLGLRDRPDPAGWITRWLLWLGCDRPDGPAWLSAYSVLVLPPETPEYANALTMLVKQNIETQLRVLFAACRVGTAVQLFPSVWPAALAAADEVAGNSPDHPRRDGLERLKNRLDGILAPSAYFYQAPTGIRAQVDTLRALLGMMPLPWLGRQLEADEYLAAVDGIWRLPQVARHLSAITKAFLLQALEVRAQAGDFAISVLNWLVLGIGRDKPLVADTVGAVLRQEARFNRALIDDPALTQEWWDALFRAVPDLAPAVQLERIGASAARGRPPGVLAQLWMGAVGQGCSVLEVMRQLKIWAERATSFEIDELLETLPVAYKGTEILILVAEGVWGKRVAEAVTDTRLGRIGAQLREIDERRRQLRDEERDLKSALKRGQRGPAHQREQAVSPATSLPGQTPRALPGGPTGQPDGAQAPPGNRIARIVTSPARLFSRRDGGYEDHGGER